MTQLIDQARVHAIETYRHLERAAMDEAAELRRSGRPEKAKEIRAKAARCRRAAWAEMDDPEPAA